MRFTVLALFILASLHLFSQNNNLQECIDYALQYRVEIQQSTNSIILSEHNERYSKYNLLPSVDFEANHNFIGAKDFLTKDGEYCTNQTGNYSLNSKLIVFDGMQSILKIKQSALLTERSKTEIEILKQEIKSEVIHAYFELLVAKENKRIIESSLSNIKKQVQIIQEIVNEGKQSAIDLFEIKAQFESEQKNLLQAELNIKKAQISLCKAINVPVESEFKITNIAEIGSVDSVLTVKDIYNSALETVPQITIAKQDSVLAKTSISIAKGQYLPYLTTSASLYSSFTEGATNPTGTTAYHFENQFTDNISHQIGFALVIPIYNRHLVKQKVFENTIKFDNTILEKKIIENNLYREIETLIETVRLQKKKIETLDEQSRLYAQVYEMKSEQYKMGALSITDYLLSERKKVNSELEVIIEEYTLQLNLKLIDLYLGKI